MSSTWDDLIAALADQADEPTVEDINGTLTDRHLRAWVERELGTWEPWCLLGEAVAEIDHDIDHKRDEKAVQARIVLDSLVASNPQTVTWRILRDSLRRNALRDARREVDALRLKLAEREAWEREHEGCLK